MFLTLGILTTEGKKIQITNNKKYYYYYYYFLYLFRDVLMFRQSIMNMKREATVP